MIYFYTMFFKYDNNMRYCGYQAKFYTFNIFSRALIFEAVRPLNDEKLNFSLNLLLQLQNAKSKNF